MIIKLIRAPYYGYKYWVHEDDIERAIESGEHINIVYEDEKIGNMLVRNEDIRKKLKRWETPERDRSGRCRAHYYYVYVFKELEDGVTEGQQELFPELGAVKQGKGYFPDNTN